MLAPVALFVYARPDHTRRTIEALLMNTCALETDLIVFADAAINSRVQSSVDQVRLYVANISGFKSLTVYHRPYNYGLANSIISGVSDVLHQYGRVIVLEDDMLTSPYFLAYMNQALDKYIDDDRVISIHGYIYPVKQSLPETFFLRGADCWGWATWSRGWSLFNADGQQLLRELRRRKLTNAFDFDGTSSYTKMLEAQINGKNDSWAVRWYASAFLADKVTLYPGRSLVHNIGIDNSGTHCGKSEKMDVNLSTTPILLDSIDVKESISARAILKQYFSLSHQTLLLKFVFNHNFLSKIRRSFFALLKDCIPPVLFRQFHRFITALGGGITFYGPFSTWDDAVKCSIGYDADQILEKVLTSTLMVKNGEAMYERDSVIFDEIQYSWPVTAGLMRAAACSGGRLSVLDFGGSLGSSYFQNRKFLDRLVHINWSVVEQPNFVKAGREFIQNSQLFFYGSVSEAVAFHKPNVVLFSSVLQYLENPYLVLDEVSLLGASFIIIDHVIVTNSHQSQIYCQTVPKSICHSSYPVRTLPEQQLLSKLSQLGYSLVASFSTLNFPALKSIRSSFLGYIFIKN